MARHDTGRVFSSGKAKTLYVSIPSAVVSDSTFPFEEGETVTIRIENEELRVTPTDEATGDEERPSTPPGL